MARESEFQQQFSSSRGGGVRNLTDAVIRQQILDNAAQVSQQPFGRPGEGLMPLPTVAGLTRMFGELGPERGNVELNKQLFRAGVDLFGVQDPHPENALLRGYGGNFRGGSSTGGPAGPSGNIGQAQATFGLGRPASQGTLRAIGFVPGIGTATLVNRAIQGLFGPQFGVIGAETIAPQVGTAAFGRTVGGGSFGSNRGPGSRGGGFGHFGGPR